MLDRALSADFAAIEAEEAKEGRREFSIVSRTHDDSVRCLLVLGCVVHVSTKFGSAAPPTGKPRLIHL